jgi:hypothetical protein
LNQDGLPEPETENLLVSIAASSAAYMAAEIILSGQSPIARTGLFLLVAVPGVIAGEMAVNHSEE